jgi:hypothetical protein
VNNAIYAGAVLTIGITEPGKIEILCGASVMVSCTIPGAPVISPTISTIIAGQSVTYNITGSQTGILYSLRDNTDNLNVGTSGVWFRNFYHTCFRSIYYCGYLYN